MIYKAIRGLTYTLATCLVLAGSASAYWGDNDAQMWEEVQRRASQAQTPHLDAALKIADESRQANKRSIDGLRAYVAGRHADEAALEGLILVIQKEKEALAAYAELEKPLDWIYTSIPLRSSLGKLIGSTEHTGLLDDAVAFLNTNWQAIVSGTYNGVPCHNEITVEKTALTYAALYLGEFTSIADAAAEAELSFLVNGGYYPAVAARTIESPRSLLFGRYSNIESALWVPNAGYIYGGNVVNEEHPGQNGLDCSSLLCSAVGANRVATYHWRWALKLWHREVAETNEAIRGILDSPQKTVFDDFEEVEDVKDIMPGDLVVWLNTQNAGGHAAMFAGWKDEGTVFYALEDNRFVDKSVEGIWPRLLNYNWGDRAITYILRRR